MWNIPDDEMPIIAWPMINVIKLPRWILLAQNTNDIICSQNNKNVVNGLNAETKRHCIY